VRQIYMLWYCIDMRDLGSLRFILVLLRCLFFLDNLRAFDHLEGEAHYGAILAVVFERAARASQQDSDGR
jgi:hypothetical protein